LSKETEQALARPPRLKQDGSGYDWREFDRWLQQIQKLLGAYADGQKAINLFSGHLDNQSAINVTTVPTGMISTAMGLAGPDNSFLLGMIPNAAGQSSRKDDTLSEVMAMLSGIPETSSRSGNDDILTLYWAGV
jgi:hypothetical protein